MGISAGIGVAGLVPGVCTSTTRPANPYEGQMIYETDTDMLAVWNGSAWRYIAATTPTSGTVLQVASTTKTDTWSSNSTSFTDITGLSVSITPKSTSSKILVTAALSLTSNSIQKFANARIVRDSTAIGVGTAASNRPGATFTYYSDISHHAPVSFSHLDSPSSTSSLTYKVQAFSESGAYVGVGYVIGDDDETRRPRLPSSITVMEVAG